MPKTFYFVLAALLAIADQLSKYLAKTLLSSDIAVIPGLSFSLRFNTGAAFSFLADAGGWQRWFFSAIAITVIIALIISILKNTLRLENIAYSLLLAGAAGNLYDRLLFAKVTDFIILYYQFYEWPAFNLADVYITLGAAILIWLILKGGNRGVRHN